MKQILSTHALSAPLVPNRYSTEHPGPFRLKRVVTQAASGGRFRPTAKNQSSQTAVNATAIFQRTNQGSLPTMLTMRSSQLTKPELADVVGTTETQIDQWVRDGVIPAHYYARGEDRAYRFAPVTVAVCELMLELQSVYGVTSPRPKEIVKQFAPKLELAWQQPDSAVHVAVTAGPYELRGTTSAFSTARKKLSAFATA